ncbi:MAG TPA: glucose 1-dehydrogenase [Geminicoccus sp.]|jgi:NAD(P)-dependent dehydrogenase (short-subunit alcohol dehydrogenase family)|uniref:SDR family NAD(P)-dependent oxidoreductase n=1 Tax=Geminicoccus sp. TaxID=2024832 RepID=UPI002E345A11|nr:glucose 1-dehydrogenase [Geminicoccus sp.]HEX2527764.1 glucose 1-dehydrogenase [Geminicoccus sp.]
MDALSRFRFDGKAAAVTGAARGIGFAVAELLAGAGAEVALIDLNAELGPASAQKIGSSGRRAEFYAADLRDPALCQDVVGRIAGDFGRIDVLVNCVGINPNTDVLEIPPEEWREVQDVNVNAMFFTNQAFARHMVKHGGGSIVAIGSNSGFTVDKPQPQAHYNTSKAAVHQMVKSLAIELAPFKVRVNAVAPGYTLTEMTRLGLSKREWVEVWEEMTPMKRFAEPDEIAHAVLFLASDAASYCTGTILLVDGGYTCW